MFLNKASEIKVKTFWDGEIEVILPEMVSISIWRNGFVESDVTIYLLKYLNNGETFVDIGAHFGFYSLLASSIVGAGRTSIIYSNRLLLLSDNYQRTSSTLKIIILEFLI